MDDAALGARIRLSRENAGLSARAVAVGIGMDPSAYAKSEAGKRSFKAIELVAISDLLHQAVDAVIQRPDAADVTAIRRARAAGEEAVGAVAAWMTAASGALGGHAGGPDALLEALHGDGRAQSASAAAEFIDQLLPRARTVAVLPGTRELFEAALRAAMPARIYVAEGVPPEPGNTPN